MNKKKLKKIVIILVVTLIGLFYFSDPLEVFNDFDIPENDNDIILCYYQAELGTTNQQYFIITRNGNVKLYEPITSTLYEDLVEWNKSETNVICTIPPSKSLLKKLKKINPNNWRFVSKTYRTEIAEPESLYMVVQNHGDGFFMEAIKQVEYNGYLGDDPRTISICRSSYTNDICDYLDKVISECDKKMENKNLEQ